MSDPVLMALIGLVAGGVGGIGTALVTPWAQWGVDQRRSTRERRRDLIASWREGLSKWESAQTPNQIDASQRQPSFIAEAWYGSLSRHMADDVRRELENSSAIRMSLGRNAYAKTVQKEIDRLAVAWDLD